MPIDGERASNEPGAAHFEDAGQERQAHLAGMWLFLATELLLFGGLFCAYAVYRVSYGPAFAAAAGELDLKLGAINTAILITSGLAMALTEPAMAAGRRRAALTLLATTGALALVFLSIKGLEYHHEIGKGLAPLPGLAFRYDGPRPEQAEMFFNFYFAMTGLHALHMAIGVGLIGWMAARIARWRRPAKLERRLRIVGLYWAFVDAVWLLLFPTLYLLRGG
ncbi:cytochrome/quinol oxidase subunit 3 [Minwuia thermotolerans]|uniref:Cytochrome/quinol oxidase subunit 3 n=1 Tax=Minwuia thermotolerans TaxID=2056226 RepID=A0A2M9G319_9PROT|nr:cytochrome/quinol oxidase subunit 3 [Minwuia thermotolerans]